MDNDIEGCVGPPVGEWIGVPLEIKLMQLEAESGEPLNRPHHPTDKQQN